MCTSIDQPTTRTEPMQNVYRIHVIYELKRCVFNKVLNWVTELALRICAGSLFQRLGAVTENGWFSILCKWKLSHILIACERTFSPQKNDTNIVKFGSVILILWQFHESLSFSTFRPFSHVNVPWTAFYTLLNHSWT